MHAYIRPIKRQEKKCGVGRGHTEDRIRPLSRRRHMLFNRHFIRVIVADRKSFKSIENNLNHSISLSIFQSRIHKTKRTCDRPLLAHTGPDLIQY